MLDKRNVVVAMSGGVDSSVAAALLVEAGHNVTGMMLRLWSEPGSEASNRCCTPESVAQARRVASKLGIPFYVIDAKNAFREQVVVSFIHGYSQGVTPNPCLVCNRSIRWGLLLEHALNMGADYLATGHYAQVKMNPSGTTELFRGIDHNKDQSYVLSVLNQEQLAGTMLPLGGYTKPAVRELAHRLGLAVAERPDSQDLCFLAGEDYREFLARHAPGINAAGAIINSSGVVLGRHNGLAYYTIGQRKGLGIHSQVPMYVLEKRVSENILVVGEEFALGHTRLNADRVNWISGEAKTAPFPARAKVRYRSTMAAGTVIPTGEDRVEIKFEQAIRDITPGQQAVFYSGDQVIGGGNIVMGYD